MADVIAKDETGVHAKPRWLRTFPELDRIGDAVWRKAAAAAQERHLDGNTALFRPGDRIECYPLVVAGSIKVTKDSSRGRKVLLYRVSPGEICTLCSSVLLADGLSPVTAVAETETDVAVIEAASFRHAYANSPGFREFVIRSFALRFRTMIDLIDQITFLQLDTRLAKWLVMRTEKADAVHVSHQELAIELGTAREVISRVLKNFEKSGLLRLGRARIDVVNRRGLMRIYERGTGA